MTGTASSAVPGAEGQGAGMRSQKHSGQARSQKGSRATSGRGGLCQNGRTVLCSDLVLQRSPCCGADATGSSSPQGADRADASGGPWAQQEHRRGCRVWTLIRQWNCLAAHGSARGGRREKSESWRGFRSGPRELPFARRKDQRMEQVLRVLRSQMC